MRMRQIALVAEKLDHATDLLEQVLGLEICHRDPGVGKWGLENALLPIGHDFIEVVAPTQDNTTATRYLERRKGDGGYMVILQCDDGVGERQRISDLGVRVAFFYDREPYHCTQYHPADVGGTLLEVDSMDNVTDHLSLDASWGPAGDDWLPKVNTQITKRLIGVALQSTDPSAMADNWARVLNTPLAQNDEGGKQMIFNDGTTVRFVQAQDGRGDGLSELDIVADVDAVLKAAQSRNLPISGRQITLCGMRINLHEE